MSSATTRDLRVYGVFREITTYMLFDMIYISASFLNNVILLYLGVCFICENTFTNSGDGCRPTPGVLGYGR